MVSLSNVMSGFFDVLHVGPLLSRFTLAQSRKDVLATQRQNFHPFRQCLSAGQASKSSAAQDEYLYPADDDEVGGKADIDVTTRPSPQRAARRGKPLPVFFQGSATVVLTSPSSKKSRISQNE
jgi:hypothetical protein